MYRSYAIAVIAAFNLLPAGWPSIEGNPRLRPAAERLHEPLSQPVVFVNRAVSGKTVEVNLTAEPARLALRPGPLTDVFAYNGRIPGPTLEAREGDRVIIHFENRLPVETTVHWHGLHIPFDADGSPFHPVGPGERRDYSFTLQPGSAGTYWYHPHPNHATAHQVAKGLYGALIVRAPDDPLPASLAEKVLILSDNRLLKDNSIDFPDMNSMQRHKDLENGREGDIVFVNGQVMPEIAIRAGETQRWRVINASASRVYRLAISGNTLLHVGNDGGLFETPREVKELVIANGERVEFLVRGTGKPGSRVMLQALPYDRYVIQTRPENWMMSRDLASLAYTPQSPVPAAKLPKKLRAIPAIDPATSTATRTIVFSQGMINGKHMDMNRVDISTKLGATEIWEIENIVGMDHPFHLHGFQFQVLDRNGVPEPYRSWKDMVNVPKHQTARIIVRYTDYPGKWMFHCHILDHEDHGMMGVLEVK